MLTAFISPARCVEVSCFANASTATRPSGSYGNKAAAMPCTLRRGAWRSINSSTVISDLHNLGSPQWARVLCLRRSMSAFLGVLQFFRQGRVSVVCVQRIATGRQSVTWCGQIAVECPANQLALDLAACRCRPKKLGIAQYHPAEPHEVGPSFAHYGLRYVGEEVLQVDRKSTHLNSIH